MTTRKYTSRSQQTTLSSAVTSGATVIPVVAATTLLGGATVSTGQTFTVVIDPDTALEEVIDVTAVSGSNLTVTRAIDGSSAQDHAAGAVIRHMIIGRDLREANTHIESTSGVHGVTGSLVGTTDAQTLTNKTIDGGSNTLTNIATSSLSTSVVTVAGSQTITGTKTLNAAVLGGNLDANSNKIVNLTTPTTSTDAASKGYVDSQITSLVNGAPTTLNQLNELANALNNDPNYSTTITTALSTKLPLAGGTMTGTLDMGANKITSTYTPVNGSDLTNKSYVDTNSNAAATSAASAATSATSAATSATSAAASATAAATSATSAAASFTAAATSASSASTQASNASGFATAASSSATAAATSATSAAASAKIGRAHV